jgi:hypothetical protein
MAFRYYEQEGQASMGVIFENGHFFRISFPSAVNSK